MTHWERHGYWVIEQYELGRIHLHLKFEAGTISLAQIVALRRVVPELARKVPAEFRAMLAATSAIDLGERGIIDGGALRRQLEAEGFCVVARNASRTETIIVCNAPAGRSVWLIEDAEEHDRTVAEMIAEGVPIRRTAVD